MCFFHASPFTSLCSVRNGPVLANSAILNWLLKLSNLGGGLRLTRNGGTANERGCTVNKQGGTANKRWVRIIAPYNIGIAELG